MSGAHVADGSGVAPQVRQCQPRSQASAWVVVLLAGTLLLAGAAALELIHRAAYEFTVGRPPADWADPQVQAFSRAQAMFLSDPFRAGPEAMRRVAEMRAAGDVTASAWWDYYLNGTVLDEPRERAKYALKALSAAPDDSPRLAMYYGSYARALSELEKTETMIAAFWETVQRAVDPEPRAMLVSRMMCQVIESGRAQDAIDAYTEVSERYAKATAHPSPRIQLAVALGKVGREQEAEGILRDIAATADDEYRQRALERLDSLSGGEDQ